ncbi:hypothetical protein GCM10022376_15950 [Yimella lutea]
MSSSTACAAGEATTPIPAAIPATTSAAAARVRTVFFMVFLPLGPRRAGRVNRQCDVELRFMVPGT